MRARAFWIGPADHDEFLSVEAFGFAPEAAVARRIGRVDRLGDDALEAQFAGVLEDKLAVAGDVVIVLKAGRALDERQAGGVAAVEVQKVEDVID